MTKQPRKILTGVLRPGETPVDVYRRAEAEYEDLGKPGPVLSWHEDEDGEWCRMLVGGVRVVALVGEYPPDLDPGYFYCVGDGPTEVSSEKHFDSLDAARAAADACLIAMGYTFWKED